MESVDELATSEEKSIINQNNEVSNYIKFSLYGIAAAAAKWLGENEVSTYMAKGAIKFRRRTEARDLFRIYLSQGSVMPLKISPSLSSKGCSKPKAWPNS